MIKRVLLQKQSVSFSIVSIITLLFLLSVPCNVHAESWVTKTPMPTAREGATSSVVNGKIYVIGGYNSLNMHVESNPIGIVEEYNPATDTWTNCGGTCTPMPTPRYGTSSGVVNNKIYVIGGKAAPTSYTTTVEEYNPANNTWITKASMQTGRVATAAAVANGKIYVFGGSDYTSWFNIVEEYDPATNIWTTKTPMPTTRNGITSTVANGKIYVMGGYNGSIYFNIVEEYDPVSDTWTNCGGACSPMPTERTYLTSNLINNKIAAIGGIRGTSVLNTVEQYNPATNTWTTKISMPTPRVDHSSSIVNEKIYVIGGVDYNHDPIMLNTVEEYTDNPTPVGYNPQWLMVTLVSLMGAGGYLIRRKTARQ